MTWQNGTQALRLTDGPAAPIMEVRQNGKANLSDFFFSFHIGLTLLSCRVLSSFFLIKPHPEMAEAVGIAAAAVQFLDISARLLVKLSWICSEIRDVPESLRNLRTDVQHHVAAAGEIAKGTADTFSSHQASAEFEALLLEYVDNMEALHNLLEEISQGCDAGLIQRGWSAVRTINKKSEILDLCNRLEQKKTQISMWITNMSL